MTPNITDYILFRYIKNRKEYKRLLSSDRELLQNTSCSTPNKKNSYFEINHNITNQILVAINSITPGFYSIEYLRCETLVYIYSITGI